MNNVIFPNKWDRTVLEEHRNDNYLSLLEKVRSQASKSKISDLIIDENQKIVRNAISALDPKAFTIQQWRIAAYYLTGRTIDIASSEQFKSMILQDLSR